MKNEQINASGKWGINVIGANFLRSVSGRRMETVWINVRDASEWYGGEIGADGYNESLEDNSLVPPRIQVYKWLWESLRREYALRRESLSQKGEK